MEYDKVNGIYQPMQKGVTAAYLRNSYKNYKILLIPNYTSKYVLEVHLWVLASK